MKLAVIIPTHNRWHEAIRSIECLLSDNYQSKIIILIDDGSTDGTSNECATLFPEVVLLQGDGNLWWSGAINVGIRKAMELRCDMVMWLNDDNRVESHTISEMVASYRRNGPDAIICSRTRSTETLLDEWAGEPPRWHKNYESFQRLDLSPPDILVEHPPGGRGVLIPIECFNKIGFVDQRRFPHYWADHDFHYRAMAAGYQYYLATSAAVWNVPNQRRADSADEFSMSWVIGFLFSRRSSMNLLTLHSLLIRHLSFSNYLQTYLPLSLSTITWLASGSIARQPSLRYLLHKARRLLSLVE